MVVPKGEGGMGLCVPHYIEKTAMDSLWVKWIQVCYIRGATLDDICHVPHESPLWSNILRGHDHIVACLQCDAR